MRLITTEESTERIILPISARTETTSTLGNLGPSEHWGEGLKDALGPKWVEHYKGDGPAFLKPDTRDISHKE